MEDLRLQIATLERREPGATRPKISPENRFMLNTVRRVQKLGPKKALKFLDDLISDPKQDPRMRNFFLPLASNTARSLGDFATVKRYSELLLANDPDDAMALFALADCLEELGEMETAKKYAMKCYERGLAMEGVLGNSIIELLEKRFPDIKPSAS